MIKRSFLAVLVAGCLCLTSVAAKLSASSTTNDTDSAFIGPPRALSSSHGSFQALVLLIRFSNHVDRVLPNITYIQDLCSQQIAVYYKQQSYSQYQMTCHVEDWYTTKNTEAYYSKGISGQVGSVGIQEMFRPKLDALDAAAGGGTGSLTYWGQFDADMDGLIDSLFVFHSGYPAEFSGADCETGALAKNRIFSQGHQGERDPGGWQSADGNFALSGMSVGSALNGVCKLKPANMGIATHEHIHTFNAFHNNTNPPDLYDKSTGNVGGVGGFDIMSNPFGPVTGFNGSLPGSMGPWSKLMAQWIKPILITSNGNYTASPSTTAPDYYRIILGPPNEYLILEYRIPVSFDADFYGSGGLIVWHIDEAANGQASRGFPGQAGWPANGNHYRVAIAPHDGLYEIEQGINIGDAGDLFVPGDSLGPNTNGSTFPNTDSYQAGNIVPSGITVTVDSMDSSGLTFTVSGMQGVAGPQATRSPIAAPSASSVGAPSPSAPSSSDSGPSASGSGSPSETSTSASNSAGSGKSSSAPALPLAQGCLGALLASWVLFA